MKQDQSQDAPLSLVPVYLKKKEQSLESVRSAIILIQKRGQKVTLQGIVKTSIELVTETGNGTTVSHTTILRNPECRVLYEEATIGSRKRSPRKSLKRVEPSMTEFELARAGRLSRCTKQELIMLLIKAERDFQAQLVINAKLREKLIHLKLDEAKNRSTDLD